MTSCSFCGRDGAECKGGLWHGPSGSGRRGEHRICVYCARAAVRSFGEVPDAGPAVVAPLRPMPVCARAQRGD